MAKERELGPHEACSEFDLQRFGCPTFGQPLTVLLEDNNNEFVFVSFCFWRHFNSVDYRHVCVDEEQGGGGGGGGGEAGRENDA